MLDWAKEASIVQVAAHFPKAEVVFDKYHVVAPMQKAVDEVRREEQRTSPGRKRSRWLLLRQPSGLPACPGPQRRTCPHPSWERAATWPPPWVAAAAVAPCPARAGRP